jgi:hypothetical protein
VQSKVCHQNIGIGQRVKCTAMAHQMAENTVESNLLIIRRSKSRGTCLLKIDGACCGMEKSACCHSIIVRAGGPSRI